MENLQVTQVWTRRLPGRPAPLVSRPRACAEVALELNGSLILKGMRIMEGRYGRYLSFPCFKPGHPARIFEPRSNLLRAKMQKAALAAFEKDLPSPAPAPPKVSAPEERSAS